MPGGGPLLLAHSSTAISSPNATLTRTLWQKVLELASVAEDNNEDSLAPTIHRSVRMAAIRCYGCHLLASAITLDTSPTQSLSTFVGILFARETLDRDNPAAYQVRFHIFKGHVNCV